MKQLLWPKRIRRAFACFAVMAFLLLLFVPQGWAQTTTEPTQVPDLLKSLEKQFNITFSYESDLLEGVYVNAPSFQSTSEALVFFEQRLNLQFEPAGDQYYLITPKITTFCLEVKDAEVQVPIPGVTPRVNGKVMNYDIEGEQISFRYAFRPKDSLSIQTIGYLPVRLGIGDLLTKECKTVYLSPSPVHLEEYKVDGYLASGVSANIDEHSIDIDMSTLALIPGETDGDVLESVKALPGLNSPNGRAGNIHIRGSSPDQSFLLFDDIPIYHQGHYFGTISPYNPGVVDEIQVYRNGYSPQLGGRVGGAIAVNTPTDIADSVTAGVGVNTLYGGANLTAPLIPGKLSMTAGVRAALPGEWASPKQQEITDMIFAASRVGDAAARDAFSLDSYDLQYYDANFKLNYRPNDRHRVLLSGIYIYNLLDYRITDYLDLVNDHEASDLLNSGANLQWLTTWNDHLLGEMSLTYSNFRYRFAENDVFFNDTVQARTSKENSVTDYAARYSLSYYQDNDNVIQLGYELKNQSSYYFTNRFNFGTETGGIRLDHEGISHSPFLNYKLNQWNKLRVQLGLRGTHFSGDQTFRVEPRIFANYTINDRWLMKLSSGMYNQYVSQLGNVDISGNGINTALWVVANDQNVGIIHGHQHMLGALFHANDWTIDLETYYKEVDDVTYLEGIRLETENTYQQAFIRSYGADLLIKKKLSEQLSAFVSYSYSSSQIAFDSLPNTFYPTEWEQPHVVSTVVMYQRGNWKLSAAWRYGTGLSTLAPILDDNVINGDAGNSINTPNQPNNGGTNLTQSSEQPYVGDRYPDVHQLDLSTTYVLQPKSWEKLQGVIGVSLINVYNRQNYTEQVLRIFGNQNEYLSLYSLGFSPNVMLSLQW